jgi:AraC family transcriptional regulator
LLEENFDAPPSLRDSAEIAGLSPFHFHRVFKQVVGETFARYHLKIRLERAAFYLRSSNWSVGEISLSCGFDSHEGFTRAFRRRYNRSPRDYRSSQAQHPYLHALAQKPALPLALNKQGPQHGVRVMDWQPVNLACLRFFGTLVEVPLAWNRLLDWARPRGLFTRQTLCLGLWYDDWNSGEPDTGKYRYDAAIALPEGRELPDDPHCEVLPLALEGGSVAVLSARGNLTEIDRLWQQFAFGWLPLSGWQPRTSYVLDRYPPDLVEKSRVELLARSVFQLQLDLCIPVQKNPVYP